MRVSEELSKATYRIVEARRDNQKGVLPEWKYMSFMYTTDEIQSAINKQSPLVAGQYYTNDYEIADKLKKIFTPSVIKFSDTEYDLNVKDDQLPTGRTALKESKNVYSITNRPYDSLEEEYELKKAANPESNGLVNPVGKTLELLSPDDYKLVQETLFKQAGINSNVQFTSLSDIRNYSNTHKTIEAVIDEACFGGKMFTADRTNGIRPIALKEAMFPFKDFTFCIYDAESMFLRWFEKQVFGASN